MGFRSILRGASSVMLRMVKSLSDGMGNQLVDQRSLC
jgi:hypothetical protein